MWDWNFEHVCGERRRERRRRRGGAEHIAKVARENIKSNGFDEQGTNQIQIVHGKLEDIAGEIPNAPFDVLVSEWMGYGLLFESMLDTVLVARDRFLNPVARCCRISRRFTSLVSIARRRISHFGTTCMDLKCRKFPNNYAGALKTAVVAHVDGRESDDDGGARVNSISPRVRSRTPNSPRSLRSRRWRRDEAKRRTGSSSGLTRNFPNVLRRPPRDALHESGRVEDALVQTMLHFHEPIVLGDSVEDASARVGSAANQGSKIVGRISMVKSKRLRAYDISPSIERCPRTASPVR